jgi:hypothetical protein
MTETKSIPFEQLDKPAACTKCGKDTTVMFTGRVCSGCAGVWSPAQQADLAWALRNPIRPVERKRTGGGKSREDLFKAAPKSKDIEEQKY